MLPLPAFGTEQIKKTKQKSYQYFEKRFRQIQFASSLDYLPLTKIENGTQPKVKEKLKHIVHD